MGASSSACFPPLPYSRGKNTVVSYFPKYTCNLCSVHSVETILDTWQDKGKKIDSQLRTAEIISESHLFFTLMRYKVLFLEGVSYIKSKNNCVFTSAKTQRIVYSPPIVLHNFSRRFAGGDEVGTHS